MDLTPARDLSAATGLDSQGKKSRDLIRSQFVKTNKSRSS